MIDFRDELEAFWNRFGLVFLTLATLYIVGHVIWYLVKGWFV